MWLVLGAVHHYCLGGCSAPVLCARHWRQVRGDWGRCRVSCLPRFPLPAPCFSRCVWWAVPSGCPLSSLAGTPFHAVCAFRGLGPVALLVFPACSLNVCALALSRRRPPPPLWVGMARVPRGVPVLGAGRADPRGPCPSACPASVPCSVWLALGGGGGPVSFPPCLAWGCVPPWGTSQRALLQAGFARCGGGTRAPGRRLLPGCGASGVGRSPTPDRSSFGACCQGPLPTGCGCGECGRGDLSPTPQRALSRAGFARCGGGPRARGGGASCLGVGRPGTGLSHPRPLVLWGVQPGPTTHWLLVWRVWAWGTVTNPTACALANWLCVLWGRQEGSRGGAPLAWVWSIRDRALCSPRPLVLWGVLPGPTTHWMWVPGVRAWGPVTNPTTRAVGAAQGRPGGACLAWAWGVQSRARSQPRPLVLWSVLPGPTTHWLCVRGVRGSGPVTKLTARALASWLCALWGRHEGGRGWRPLAWAWGVRYRALSHPQRPVLWCMRSGPTTNWLWMRGLRALGPVTKPTARALARWLCVPWGRQEGARGRRPLPGRGASRVGRSPASDRSSFGACDQGQLPPGCRCGGRGRGDPS